MLQEAVSDHDGPRLEAALKQPDAVSSRVGFQENDGRHEQTKRSIHAGAALD